MKEKTAIFILVALMFGCIQTFKSTNIQHCYDNLDLGIPGECDQIIDREGYALGWSKDWMQPKWVTYRLTEDEVASNVVKRTNSFMEDPAIEGGSSKPSDYSNSGYDKGHLAPAADMHWSTNTMQESFYMSNMSPQTPQLNRRVWADIEAFARRQALNERSIFIVTGPIIFSNAVKKTIGKRDVTVPDAFYKVIYDETPPCKMIAFIVPNEDPSLCITSHVTTVSNVEAVTQLNLFSNICTNDECKCLKLQSDITAWKK